MLWTVIDGVLYDITNYVDQHPGGKKKITRGVGKDASAMFHKFHKGIEIAKTPLIMLQVGQVYQLDKQEQHSEDKSPSPINVEHEAMSGIEIEQVDSDDEMINDNNEVWAKNA